LLFVDARVAPWLTRPFMDIVRLHDRGVERLRIMRILEVISALALIGVASAKTPIAAMWATVVLVTAALIAILWLDRPAPRRAGHDAPMEEGEAPRPNARG
jgi:hypothetical protein